MRKAVSSNAMPCHHALAEALRAYIDTAGIVEDRTGWLFRTARGHDGSSLSDKQMSQPDAVEDAWHRRGPVAAAASAGGSRGGRAACILYAQQSRCPLGFRIPQPARTSRGVRCAGALVVPHRSLS
jgi:hypothetical protein